MLHVVYREGHRTRTILFHFAVMSPPSFQLFFATFRRFLPVSKLTPHLLRSATRQSTSPDFKRKEFEHFLWGKTPKGVGEQAGGVSLRGETSASQKVETVTDHKQLHNFFDGKCSLGIAILTLSLAWGVKTDGVRDQKLLDLNDQPDREAVQPPPQEVRD
jgi:hypothetical protein